MSTLTRRARAHAERYHQRNAHPDDFSVRVTICDPQHAWNGTRFTFACELTASEADALIREINRDGHPGTYVPLNGA